MVIMLEYIELHIKLSFFFFFLLSLAGLQGCSFPLVFEASDSVYLMLVLLLSLAKRQVLLSNVTGHDCDSPEQQVEKMNPGISQIKAAAPFTIDKFST